MRSIGGDELNKRRKQLCRRLQRLAVVSGALASTSCDRQWCTSALEAHYLAPKSQEEKLTMVESSCHWHGARDPRCCNAVVVM